MGDASRNNFDYSNGTTAYETFLVILPSVFLTFIVTYLSNICRWENHLNVFLFEYTLLVIPTILNFTVLAENISIVVVALFVISCSLFFISRNKTKHCNNVDISSSVHHKHFITNVRSTTNLLTAVAILAVDFRIFPRHFAKTETYGYSLMDVGVGLFIYSNGIIAPQVQQSKFSMIKLLKSNIPIFVLGIGRFLATSGIDYHVPVSEYGVHWNFFITLAITKILSSLILNFVPVRYVIVNAVLLLMAHEILLQLGVAQFVLSNVQRSNFLLANREGIVSCLGYLSLYIFSVYFGSFMRAENSKVYSPAKCSFFALFMLCSTLCLQSCFGISRRLANSAYCCWILFIGSFMTTLYYVCEIVQRNIFGSSCKYGPIIFDAVNFNGLTFFLVSNLLTGAINVMFTPQEFNTLCSLVTLVVYMILTCGIIYLLYLNKIRLKL